MKYVTELHHEDTCSWEDDDGVLLYSKEKSKRGTSYFTITSTRALSDSYIISYKLYGFTEKENISPMQFRIPEIRLGTFNEVKGAQH